ncbi:MAG: precorrin-6y C5,15-methyltransferase (decarboxylating) subunit CbiE [Candidatus Loosdrechtia sp.]|uniref:cobalt-precorrin-7 (C(5))-methyltransferase n=1 Tax=Candidatus Loosdrechtia sp. TaxID=3101272 RepID=UPI003A738602|nr:MAG: precorrin-6y C5,15-methyltransferase (decarboxylating) subunit CbiE [Candidatus Jettenia sp. AMX2]
MDKQQRNKVIIIGCGPGLKSYIFPRALSYIKKADILVGSRRLLKLFPDSNARKIVLEKNYRTMIDKIGAWSYTEQVVVLVSGDPGFFSYTKMMVKTLGRENCMIIPGISSIQLAFAAIGESWDDACFISLHGRDSGHKELVKKVREHDKVGILTDDKNTPAVIARRLLKNGMRGRRMYVCENLSLPDERICEMDLTSALTIKTKGMVVVVVIRE